MPGGVGRRALLGFAALAALAAVSAAGFLAARREGVGSRREPPAFSADSAFAFLESQCRLGPRVPGSEAHRNARALLEGRLRELSPRVSVHEFRGRSAWGEDLVGWNLTAEFGSGGHPLLLGAHWDSRARADRDPDPARRGEPVPGANDGASGVAVLMEMGRLFHAAPPPREVILACFDLEDQGSEDEPESFCLGSRALAAEIPYTPGAQAVVLDMVGGRNLEIPEEGFSLELAAPLVRELWALAPPGGPAAFVTRPGDYVFDDHLPFLRRGWQAVDLVDLRYPEWHTVRDTPEACDRASLAVVGGVLRSFVYGPRASRAAAGRSGGGVG